MSDVHRVRRCGECGKRLGGTLAYCRDCGGEKPQPSDQERLLDGVRWKLQLGVQEDRIAAAHDPTPDWSLV